MSASWSYAPSGLRKKVQEPREGKAGLFIAHSGQSDPDSMLDCLNSVPPKEVSRSELFRGLFLGRIP